MECNKEVSFAEEDEEDLEALRMAALQSIKRKTQPLIENKRPPINFHSGQDKPMRFNRSKGGPNKRGRFFGPPHGRNNKNGQFNNFNGRVRNSNLIAITPISDDDNKVETEKSNSPKLVLPQDRYIAQKHTEEKSNDNSTSKFDRYEHSDKSDSESEEEAEDSETDSPGKLEKSDSLEALMQELDDEIQGIKKPKEEKPPVKKKSKKKKNRTSESGNEISESEVKDSDKPLETSDDIKPQETNEVIVAEEKLVHDEGTAKENLKPEEQKSPQSQEKFSPNRFRRKSRSRSPKNRPVRKRKRNFNQPNFPFSKPVQPFIYPPIPPYQGLPFENTFNPAFIPPLVEMSNPPPHPPFGFDRPLSPLSINTDQLTAVTMAPLSPRSARFVLQNREIIEKRKRRSYSRSPSPRSRRSRSPRRSLSPFSRRSSLSPRRRSLSPRRMSPPRKQQPLFKKEESLQKNKPPIRERLGHKPINTTNVKVEEKACPKIEEQKLLDPVLEARKRKFENKEINVKGGIIRLKPKEESLISTKIEDNSTQIEKKDEKDDSVHNKDDSDIDLGDINEDALLEDDELELGAKVDDIFSDEESSSDNEGRFKEKENKNEKVPVLPFAKLVNGAKSDIKEKPLIPNRRARNHDRENRRSRRTDRDNVRSRSPLPKITHDRISMTKNSEVNTKIDEFDSSKKSSEQLRKRVVRTEKKHISPPLEKRFERKIEIKIKNPSKYERAIKDDFSDISPKAKRKVEIESKDEIDEDDAEIVVENESDDEVDEVDDSNGSEGDLRAQLSKKRAERLHKGVPVKGNASRLLQNALQGAVFTKPKKSKEKEICTEFTSVKRMIESDYMPSNNKLEFAVKTERKVRVYKQIRFYCRYPSDGKLPIHLRLGLANNTDIFSETKGRKKSKKNRNRSQEQV